MNKEDNALRCVRVAIVGKINENNDSYPFVKESLFHAANKLNAEINIDWIDSFDVNDNNVKDIINNADGIILPGGYGNRGIEGMISTAKFARENNVPLLGICLGMQIITIEFARNVLGYKFANSTEFDLNTEYPVIDLIHEIRDSEDKNKQGRSGDFTCLLEKDSLAYSIYQKEIIQERQSHRYEFNIKYKNEFIVHGMELTGRCEDTNSIEIVEIPCNKFYLGVQFHTEYKSNVDNPRPLFLGLIKELLKTKN